jgi:hypothetical protein
MGAFAITYLLQACFRHTPTITALAVTAVLAACYPSPDLVIEELDTVITAVDEDVDFQQFKTYALPDTIIYRPDAGQISEELKDLILGEIDRNMQTFGYEPEGDPVNNPPDLVVVAGIITRDEYGAYIGWPFWGGFGPYNGWGVGYPPISGGYMYTVGTVTIDMIDYEDIDSIREELKVVWTAAVNGVLQSNVKNQAQRTKDGIDQAFTQSPYLQVN